MISGNMVHSVLYGRGALGASVKLIFLLEKTLQ